MLLVAASWVSGALFGAYILIFFGGTALNGEASRWNESLDGLHVAERLWGTMTIGTHFLAGGTLLLLGPIQLIASFRRAHPHLHRWLGRLYVLSAALAGAGGLGFIVANGTIGGSLMNAGFGLYGALMILAAERTFTHARARRVEKHRAWAVRLFALTVGSWLYRMEYGLWFLTVGRTGHTSEFGGLFDAVMMFFFYLPNLAVAELFIRTRRGLAGQIATASAAAALLVVSAFVILATWAFTVDYWAPGMVSGLNGIER
jgi:hypothetical protein